MSAGAGTHAAGPAAPNVFLDVRADVGGDLGRLEVELYDVVQASLTAENFRWGSCRVCVGHGREMRCAD